MSLAKKILKPKTLGKIALGVVLLAIVFYGVFTVLFYRSLKDPSASAPLYEGPVLDHEKQRPLASPFNHATEAMEVVRGMDLSGKTIVATGGHSGTGLEAVRALTKAGANVVVLARDVERARKNTRGIPNMGQAGSPPTTFLM